MRLDHIAFRVEDRAKAARFFIDAFGYKIQTEFDLQFDNGTTTKCIALEPPEKRNPEMPWVLRTDWVLEHGPKELENVTYHLAPEIFISDGEPNSIVGQWVAKHGPGIHHLAYMVDSVTEKMAEWKEKGWAEFTSDKPMTCPGLTQAFTKPNLLGVIFEFIERGAQGFCKENVKNLMSSTNGL